MIDLKNKLLFTYWTKSLDINMWKFDVGVLNVILGESGHWKTEFAFFMAEKNIKAGNNLVYYNLEMSNKQLFVRKAKKRAGITKEQRNDKTMSDNQKNIAITEYNKYQNYTWIKDWNYTLDSIINDIYINVENGVKLFFIDNLWFIGNNNQKMSEFDFVADIIRKLKQCCNNWKIAINLLHHFSKWSDKERWRPRWIASIRANGKIENDADNIISIYRDYDDADNVTKVIHLKDRERWLYSSTDLVFEKWEYFDTNCWTKIETKEIIMETEDLPF